MLYGINTYPYEGVIVGAEAVHPLSGLALLVIETELGLEVVHGDHSCISRIWRELGPGTRVSVDISPDGWNESITPLEVTENDA